VYGGCDAPRLFKQEKELPFYQSINQSITNQPTKKPINNQKTKQLNN
jgi:hypothetical protein